MKILDNLELKLDFLVWSNGALIFKGQLCVPNNMDLKRLSLDEAHDTEYLVHSGITKMYQNLR